MYNPLAVFTPVLGASSETFIQRHVLDLCPEGTSVIYAAQHHKLFWDTSRPKFHLDAKMPLKDRVFNRLYQTISDGDRRSLLDPVRTKAVKDFLLVNKTKVILGEYLDQSLWLLKIAKELNIKFFGHAHGYDVSEKLLDTFWRNEYLKYNQADGIITMNKLTKGKLIALGVKEKLIHVIPYGVEDANFQKSFRQNEEKIKCLAVGRMVAKKAPLKLLEAFNIALKIYPNLHLDYIGTGDLLPQVENFITMQSLQNNVSLHYEKPNVFVKEKMKEADIFVQHSITDPVSGDQEGTPVAILEAMSYSLPVISTLHGGIPEAVQNGINGFLVEEGDVEGMARLLVHLAHDKDLIHAFGTASKMKFQEEFSWVVEKRRLKNLLELL
ncbi:glycosyltransferase family 4 protein [Pontibacter toksunensis]|uniref:Glycosyltransferase family 4 protein n=1 Tax=Pontibacter toksunensis TaxID=1332631 RepID=A0ABW6BNJ5_9BACT